MRIFRYTRRLLRVNNIIFYLLIWLKFCCQLSFLKCHSLKNQMLYVILLFQDSKNCYVSIFAIIEDKIVFKPNFVDKYVLISTDKKRLSHWLIVVRRYIGYNFNESKRFKINTLVDYLRHKPRKMQSSPPLCPSPKWSNFFFYGLCRDWVECVIASLPAENNFIIIL